MARGERGWRGGRDIFTGCGGGNRIWSRRGGKRLRCRVLRGTRLPFALLLRGLDELGVGADFELGILQGGEGEAWVAKFWKTSHIFLLAQSSIRETKKQLYVRRGACKNGWSFVQARDSFSTRSVRCFRWVVRWVGRWWSV